MRDVQETSQPGLVEQQGGIAPPAPNRREKLWAGAKNVLKLVTQRKQEQPDKPEVALEILRDARPEPSQADLIADYTQSVLPDLNAGIQTADTPPPGPTVVDQEKTKAQLESYATDWHAQETANQEQAAIQAAQSLANAAVARSAEVRQEIRDVKDAQLEVLTSSPNERVPFAQWSKAMEQRQQEEKREQKIEQTNDRIDSIAKQQGLRSSVRKYLVQRNI